MTTTSDDTAGPATSSWSPVSLIHLVYLGVLIYQPLFDPSTGTREIMLTVAVVVVFVPLYVYAERRCDDPQRLRRVAIPAIVALGVATITFNTGGGVLLVYAAAYVSFAVPRRQALYGFGALSAVSLLMGFVNPAPMRWALLGVGFSAVFIWIIGLVTLEDAERQREQRELRVANARIEHLSTMSERERIARDLHDLLGHSLTSIVVRAQLAQQLSEADPKRARQEAAEIEQAARGALTQVRATVAGWRQISLDDELEQADEALAAAGIVLRVDRDPTLVPVAAVERELALSLREAVTNVVRHSGARVCHVRLARAGDTVQLQITDDGRGSHAPAGSGLAGMRERIAAISGDLAVDLSRGGRVTITVPREVAL